MSQRKRCKHTRKGEERVREHTGTCQPQLPFSHTKLPLFHLYQSKMWLSHTRAPLYTSRILWKLAFDGALEAGFAFKHAKMNSIPLINPQTPFQRFTKTVQWIPLAALMLEFVLPKAQKRQRKNIVQHHQ